MTGAFSVAIDGPAGAGKSSAAKAVAKALGAMYLDTGAMYRAVGLYMLRRGVNPADAGAVAARAEEPLVDVRYVNGEQRMLLDGEDVSAAIRTPEISAAASAVSAVPQVRRAMVARQRAIAGDRSVVMDGRDIATHVLPGATLKVFLTASCEERARRRCLELAEKGAPQPYADVLKDIQKRDLQDSTRAASPLRQAEDAVLLDCSDMNLDQVVNEILRLARARIGGEDA